MDHDEKEFSKRELYYINEAERIGSAKGNCEELKALSGQAYSDYRNKTISEKAYALIHLISVNYAYPIR